MRKETITIGKPLVIGFVVWASSIGAPREAGADVVTEWNGILLDAVRAEEPRPPRASRAMACVNVATFEAVNGILELYEPYHVTEPAPPGASPEAAAAAAAHRSLTDLFPGQRQLFDAALRVSLAAIADGASKKLGLSWGVKVADSVMAIRRDDGSTGERNHQCPSGAGWWTPTPPNFAVALLPNWIDVRPWAMTDGSQFRPPPPPPLEGAEYLRAFDEVARVGRLDSPWRSKEQSQIAFFWADGPGTSTPPGHWLLVALKLASERSLALHESSRLFALLSIAVADSAIVSWDSKYHYNHWRPVTGIQHADLDGNSGTGAVEGWVPLIATPPFPSYTSGHSTFSGSAARILELFFGSDAIPFSVVSEGLPGVERFFARFSQAAEEAGQSRIYAGIHWQYDNRAGLDSGRALADYIFHNHLRPRPRLCSGSSSSPHPPDLAPKIDRGDRPKIFGGSPDRVPSRSRSRAARSPQRGAWHPATHRSSSSSERIGQSLSDGRHSARTTHLTRRGRGVVGRHVLRPLRSDTDLHGRISTRASRCAASRGTGRLRRPHLVVAIRAPPP